MKASTLALTGLLAFVGMSAFSQGGKDVVDIKWGDDVPLAKKHYPIGFVGDEKTGYLQISERTKKEIGFYKLSPKLQLEGNKIELLPKSKYRMFETILEYDGRAFFLFSDFDKATESEKLIVQEVDMKEGGFLKDPETIIETQGKVTGTFVATGLYQFAVTDKFKTIIPDDGDRILVYYRRKPEVKKNTKNFDKIVFSMYDRDWKTLWSKEITMPYTEADMRPVAYRLVGDAVYLFFQSRSGDISPDTKRAEFDRLSVLYITEDQDKPEEHTLDADDLGIDFIIGKGFGESMLIGGYTKPSRRSAVFNGYFTAVFNPKTFQLENINKFAFGTDLISAFESERTKRKLDKAIAKGKEPGIPYMETRLVVRRPNGGWYMVGEQYHMYVVTTTDSKGNVRYTYHYLYQDIIVSAVDASGTEEWIRKVPKNQHFINTTYGAGISAFVYEDNVYIFHLDHIKNKNMSESTGSPVEFRTFKDGCLMCVKIDPSGKMTRNDLFDIREEAKMILPETIDEVAPGVLLSSGRRSRLRGGKVNTPALIYLK